MGTSFMNFMLFWRPANCVSILLLIIVFLFFGKIKWRWWSCVVVIATVKCQRRDCAYIDCRISSLAAAHQNQNSGHNAAQCANDVGGRRKCRQVTDADGVSVNTQRHDHRKHYNIRQHHVIHYSRSRRKIDSVDLFVSFNPLDGRNVNWLHLATQV